MVIIMAKQLICHQQFNRFGPFTCTLTSLTSLKVNDKLWSKAAGRYEGAFNPYRKFHSRSGRWLWKSSRPQPVLLWSSANSTIRFKTSETAVRDEQDSCGGTDILLNHTIPETIDCVVCPSDLSQCLTLLLKTHYSSLQSSCSWMHESIHIGFIQMAMTNRVEALTSTVSQHATFALLCQHLGQKCREMTDSDLADSTLALVYLGLDQTSSLMHSLLFECRSRIPTASPSVLASMSLLLRVVPSRDVITLKAICKKLTEFCDSDTASWNNADIAGLCRTFLNCNQHLSRDILDKYISFVHDYAKENDLLDSLESIGMCIRMAQKSLRRNKTPMSDASDGKASKLLTLAMDACITKVDELESHNIAEICLGLKQCRKYDFPFSEAIQKRALTLLNEKDCHLRDVSNLMFSTSRSADPSMKRTLQRFLHMKLKGDTSDIIIISNLADNLLHHKHIDKDLLKLYQRIVANNADQLISYISPFSKVARFLVKKKFVDPEDEARFVEVLQQHLDLQSSMGNYVTSVIAMYLLPNSRNVLSDRLYGRLKAAIPRWKGHNLYRLLVGLNSMRKPISARMRRQVDSIQALLHTALLNQMDSIQSVDYLYDLTLGLVVHNQVARDPTLTDQLMHKYLEFSPHLTNIQLAKVATALHSIKYDLPEVYEDLVRISVDKSPDVDNYSISTVLSALARVGYQPRNFDRFVLLCLDTFHDIYMQKEDVHYGDMLKILVDLVHLSYLPEEELSHIFTLDFIEKLDTYLEKKKFLKKRVMDCMVQLNRAVVLECAQLDVPWFQEQYCFEYVATAEPTEDPAVTAYRDEIEQVLSEVLGLEGGHRRWVYSPYFCTIDFECILDENQNILNIQDVSQSGVKRSWQRVAVLAQTEHDFCYGSKQLDGPNQTKIRQLEIMGYKVVQIPHFDWFSLGLNDWQVKADYIQNKIWE